MAAQACAYYLGPSADRGWLLLISTGPACTHVPECTVLCTIHAWV